MGIKIGRIVKEFVFNSLEDQKIEIDIHGDKKDLVCRLDSAEEKELRLNVLRGEFDEFEEGEEIRVFFLLQNNYHTFDSVILKKGDQKLTIRHPEGVYKNPQRKYERIKIKEDLEVTFKIKGKTYELNFPKTMQSVSVDLEETVPEDLDTSNIQELLKEFREKMSEKVSTNRITMLRNKIPSTYEERVLAALGKVLWIPTTEADFPEKDLFPDERIITKSELIRYEESFNLPSYVVTSKLGNILYEKQKDNVFSELYCPVLYDEYLIGYIYCANREGKREKISPELVDFVFQFSKVLSFALERSGYFSSEKGGETLYRAQIIDMSASGLLFAHPNEDLEKELLIQTDMDITLKIRNRKMVIGSRVRRKFKDRARSYFGVQFLKIEPSDFLYIFEMLYGRPFTSEEEDLWEGGAPPPPLDLFND